MNSESWSETINQYIRPLVMLAFTGAFIYGFFAQVIGSDAFLLQFGVVMAWFFKSRDEAQAKKP